jgi:hypothetical protein
MKTRRSGLGCMPAEWLGWASRFGRRNEAHFVPARGYLAIGDDCADLGPVRCQCAAPACDVSRSPIMDAAFCWSCAKFGPGRWQAADNHDLGAEVVNPGHCRPGFRMARTG